MSVQNAIAVRRFDHPDETRPFAAHGRMDVVNLAGRELGLMTFEPGWSWSADVKPIAGTDSCQVHHLGYCLSGRLRVRLDDGTGQELGPGDLYEIPPGHGAEVVGDEPCVMLELRGDTEGYAKR